MNQGKILIHLFEEHGYKPQRSGVALQNYDMLHFKNDKYHTSCVCINSSSLELFIFKRTLDSSILDINYEQLYTCLSDPNSIDKIVKFIS